MRMGLRYDDRVAGRQSRDLAREIPAHLDAAASPGGFEPAGFGQDHIADAVVG
jgi:hypothetical protein